VLITHALAYVHARTHTRTCERVRGGRIGDARRRGGGMMANGEERNGTAGGIKWKYTSM